MLPEVSINLYKKDRNFLFTDGILNIYIPMYYSRTNLLGSSGRTEYLTDYNECGSFF